MPNVKTTWVSGRDLKLAQNFPSQREETRKAIEELRKTRETIDSVKQKLLRLTGNTNAT